MSYLITKKYNQKIRYWLLMAFDSNKVFFGFGFT